MGFVPQMRPPPAFSGSSRADAIRSLFSAAMSNMYRAEVPQYGDLLDLVAEVNGSVLANDLELARAMWRNGEIDRLGLERHGAIRLGTADELFNIRRVFAVFGMQPVGYYDLSVAGVPVHATAFRPVEDSALQANPFRIFTSLLRLDLIEDKALRNEALRVLSGRQIFTRRALELISVFEAEGSLDEDEAQEFVREVLETFRWHSGATVTMATYSRLHDVHRLIADVVCFRGPHINHLTPRTLDIDAVQAGMPRWGISPKVVIEGPPRRRCPILLRQTSFKALEEPIAFRAEIDASIEGSHTARFGEIEQRGAALTPKGRELYDRLLASVRRETQVGARGSLADEYSTELAERFKDFPDSWAELRDQGLAYFRYSPTPKGLSAATREKIVSPFDQLVRQGHLRFEPIIYEDFLPVSAAGIFQSNLGTDEQQNYAGRSNRQAFEKALGAKITNEDDLYANAQQDSIEYSLAQLNEAAGRKMRDDSLVG
ncbi:VOC family protein [Mesorhizobium sp. VK9D]|uniref:2-oxoadipate dioxygenase/decarboxylase HglS n=1 Tax=Mesorhizobium australafricanum TaxID=3072311 RepID=UPI002A23BD15|nr:VOC family protein [Mesorhizobium sp. VK9D]MDX8455279.1 VOC family protein [Mesorhizobium sp. VK9D]